MQVVEVAFVGPPDFFFVLGNYDNTVEVAPGDYAYSFLSRGHLWAGGDRQEIGNITPKQAILAEREKILKNKRKNYFTKDLT